MPNIRKPSVDKPFFSQDEGLEADANNHKMFKRIDIRLGLVIIWEVRRLSFTYIVCQYIATDLYIYSTIYCQSDIEIDGNRRTITGQHHVPVTTIMRMSDEKEKPKETINQKEPEKRKRVTTGNMEKPKFSNSSKMVC